MPPPRIKVLSELCVIVGGGTFSEIQKSRSNTLLKKIINNSHSLGPHITTLDHAIIKQNISVFVIFWQVWPKLSESRLNYHYKNRTIPQLLKDLHKYGITLYPD